jgi:hypothetical protein
MLRGSAEWERPDCDMLPVEMPPNALVSAVSCVDDPSGVALCVPITERLVYVLAPDSWSVLVSGCVAPDDRVIVSWLAITE